MSKISISVVIPCYNAAEYIRDTIGVALLQSVPPLEVIVVDDGSQDESAAISAALGNQVRVISRDNGGAATARNTGVRVARGDWIAFLDADDVWMPDRLEKLSKIAETADSDVVCIFNDLFYLHADGTRTIRKTPIDLLEGRYHVNLICDWLVNPSCMMVRTEAAKAVPFPEGVRHIEDQQQIVLLRRHGRFIHVPEPLTGYRRRAGQLTANPRHVIISIRFNIEFLRRHPEIYSKSDIAQICAFYGNWLLQVHDAAFWHRQYDVVRECRHIYFEIHPNPDPNPPLFDARLYPIFLVRLKDYVDTLFSHRKSITDG
jgi:glycosyltransferase involved in cell wall biosynthesis